ncbi:MAG: glycosyltransferase [Clostridiales bacterium]|nr:glycosyltransferase [Clostridiales bacterium]
MDLKNNEDIREANLQMQAKIRKLENEISRLQFEKEQESEDKERYLRELLETRNSKTYILARKLTAIPRRLRGIRYVHGEMPEKQVLFQYMISVVIAVYNTAAFLPEMLESILKQKQNILRSYLRDNGESLYRETVYENIYEIILVDDGSDDNSGQICDEYAEKYACIRVIHKENEGVSSARNAGISMARGKYITFPDSDDKLSAEVFEQCFLFFEAHEQSISMVTYPLRFFDAQTGDHWTTYRFAEGNRILNMMNEWDKPQYFTASTFFKTEFIRERIEFNTALVNGEDIFFAHEVLFADKPFVGLVGSCTYWYRRRSSGVLSAVQQSKNTVSYYVPYITEMLGGLMRKAKEVYGEVPKYVQNAVMGQLQWRMRSDGDGETAKDVIGEEGFAEYRVQIKKLVRQLDLDVILSQKQIFREHFFYLCRIRTDHDPERIMKNDNIHYLFDGYSCFDAAGCSLKLDFMKIKHGFLFLEGINTSLEPDFETWVKLNGVKIPVVCDMQRNEDVKILGEIALYTVAFHVSVPLESATISELCFGMTLRNYDVIKKRINFGKFMPISRNYSWSYYAKEDWAVRAEGHRLLIIRITSPEKIVEMEQDFEKQVLRGKYGHDEKIRSVLSIRREVFEEKYNLYRHSDRAVRRKIWLVSDRYGIADDNGEAMFRFLVRQNLPGIDIRFVIDPESPDYDRLAGIGRVVAQDSREHIKLHLMAQYIISSQADEYIINPMWRQKEVGDVFRDYYCDSKFVFFAAWRD